MAFVVFEANATNFPVVPIIVSAVATVVLFILARLAIYLYRSGEVEVTVKRIVDLNPRVVKLSLRVENRERKERAIDGLCLVKKDKKGYSMLATPVHEPLLREGRGSFLRVSKRGFGLNCGPNEVGEMVVEFNLPAATGSVYLAGFNPKGKFVVAPLSLVDSSTQLISFHRGKLEQETGEGSGGDNRDGTSPRV